MATDILRPRSIDEHPLKRRIDRVPTPSIKAMINLVDECLFMFLGGALIHGRPRIGKSCAIDFVLTNLNAKRPKLSAYKMRCMRPQAASENTFFAGLLTAVRHPAEPAASKASLRTRVVHKLRQVTDTLGDNKVVIFIDEAQHLREIEYEWLRDLHDDLENNDVRLFTFLIGQQQLLAQKAALQAQDKEQIVARFMIEELAFKGLASEAECAAVLGAYDTSGEYPAGSGWCYTRFFVPRAYAVGLRLAESAPRVWRAFEDAHFAAQLDGPTEIPMKYFTAAIEAALLTSADTDSESLTLSASLWSAMVERSRYVMARRAGRLILGPLKTH